MLKRRLMLGIAVLVVAAIGAWIIAGSQSFKSCIHDHKNDKAYEGLQDQSITNRFFPRLHLQYDCIGHAIDEHNAVALVVATAVIAIFTVGLWIATADLLAHGRDVERAYLSGGGPFTADYPHKFVLTVQNYGKTPAFLSGYAFTVCDRSQLPIEPEYERIRFIDTISPNAPMKPIVFHPFPLVFREPVAYGRFWYTDIWREKEYFFSFILPIFWGNDHSAVGRVSRAYTDWT